MNPESRNKEAAFRFMDYMVNEGQEILVDQYLETIEYRIAHWGCFPACDTEEGTSALDIGSDSSSTSS